MQYRSHHSSHNVSRAVKLHIAGVGDHEDQEALIIDVVHNSYPSIFDKLALPMSVRCKPTTKSTISELRLITIKVPQSKKATVTTTTLPTTTITTDDTISTTTVSNTTTTARQQNKKMNKKKIYVLVESEDSDNAKGNYIQPYKELLSHKWLCSSTINNYFRLLRNHFDNATFTTTDFCQSSLTSADVAYRLIMGSVGGKQIGSGKLYIPLNLANMHWILAVVNFDDHSINVYNSMSRCNQGVHQATKTIKETLTNIANYNRTTVSRFTINLVSSPQQPNMYDCGVYVCFFAKILACGYQLLPQTRVQSRRYMMVELEHNVIHTKPHK